MRRDLHNNCKAVAALNQQAITTNTAVNGAIIDSLGFESLEFILQAKTITDGTYTPTVTVGDDSGLSDGVALPAADLLGALTAFVAADDNGVKRFGISTKKRYARLTITSTGLSFGVDIIGAVAVLGNPYSAPVA